MDIIIGLAIIGALAGAGVLPLIFKMFDAGAGTSEVLTDKHKVRKYIPPQVAKSEFSLELGTEKKTGKPFLLPPSTFTGHMLMLAKTGMGKSTEIRGILNQIIKAGLPLIVFDGQSAETEAVIAIAKKYGRHVTVLPQDGYNPLRAGKTVTERAISFAEVFSQTSGLGEGNAQYWVQISQIFLQFVIPLYEKKYNQPIIMDELIDLASSASHRKELIKGIPPCDELYNYNSFFHGRSQNKIDDALENLVLYLTRTADADIKNMYNVRYAPTISELVDRNEIIIIREGGTPTEQYKRARGLFFVNAVQKYVNTRKVGQTPMLPIIFDEAHFYFNDAFDSYLSSVRKYNVANILAFQSFAQCGLMKSNIKTNCTTWLPLSGVSAEDAEEIAIEIGERQFEISGVSHGGDRSTINTNLKYDYLYQPSKVQYTDGEEAIVLTYYNRKKQPPREIKRLSLLTITEEPYIAPVVKQDQSVFRLEPPKDSTNAPVQNNPKNPQKPNPKTPQNSGKPNTGKPKPPTVADVLKQRGNNEQEPA